MNDWNDLATDSHYRTAVAVNDALAKGDVSAARAGMQELIDALSRSDKRALQSHLILLMAHVIKWNVQPEKRSRSWRTTIRGARRDIARICHDTPSLTRSVIEAMWNDCLESATDDAEADMNLEVDAMSLAWDDVFERDYRVR